MNRLGGVQQDHGPFRVHMAKVRVPLSMVLAGWAWRRAVGVFSWFCRRPIAVAAFVVLLTMWRVTADHGPLPLLGGISCVLAGLVALRLWAPERFTRWVAWRAKGWWRSARVYRYVWQPAMVTTGLAVRVDGEEYLPKIVSIRSSGTVDLVRVRMLPGQVLEDWADNAPRLAQTFGTQECRVRTVAGRRRDLELWFLVEDPLTAEVPPFAVETTDPKALPVAMREDGLIYRLRLLGTHLLVVGATGSGKGSVLWSIIAALAPAIQDRTAQVWALDPKGGMELAAGAPLFERFVYGDPKDDTAYEVDFARALEDAVAIMRHRQARLRGVSRLHTPTREEPLIVVVVDELANLTAYVTDRDAKRRIAAALALLLSQGRAVGVSVVGAVQDPRKEVVTLRDIFPTRIALRLSEADHVGLVLGSGARDRGARCDQIPESLPGLGYVGIDGIAEPVRVRFSHITDAHIAQLVARYGTEPAFMPVVETRRAAA